MKNIFLGILVLLFFACQHQEPQKVFEGEKQFRVLEPSRIYFNNIRSSSYYKRRQPKTNIDIYTHRKFSKTRNKPLIRPIIVHEWMKDEASIFIEKNDYPHFRDDFDIAWENAQDSTAGILQLKRRSRQKQYEFAGALYEKILAKCEFYITNTKGERIPLWSDRKDKSAFVATMRDYYKLTE